MCGRLRHSLEESILSVEANMDKRGAGRNRNKKGATAHAEPAKAVNGDQPDVCALAGKGAYEKELSRLQVELVRMSEPAGVPRRSTRHADREGKNPVVFPAVRRAPAVCRRDRVVRQELV